MDSKKINDMTEPCIIIAGSGMCQGGRIQHHLRRYIGDPRNLVLVIGYMARGTVGRSLVEKERKIKIFNEHLDLKADVVVLNEFSAHADKLELLEHIKSIKNLKQIFVVHGEELETEVMRDNVYNVLKFKGRVDIPTYGEEFLLIKDTVESHVDARQVEYLKALREREDSDYEAE
jgi:metallo-beta-lactamase family protein